MASMSMARSTESNMQSAGEYPSVIDTFLDTKKGAESNQFWPARFLTGELFWVGAKGHLPDQWRLIVDQESMMESTLNCVGSGRHR